MPYGDRGGVPIEPYLTEQWYVDAETLAKPAIEAVETGRTKFVPENWSKTYFEWMRGIQPWCISRQLWWGHQIPAWYGPDGEIFVAHDESEAREKARAHYGEDRPLERDPDVLDTWFSSGLWPFSTLGWPDKTPELQRYYPSDVLVTGFDIIFFWVARMMMMGLHFMGDVPFRHVYIHALVRDQHGKKMSKTLGNVIDPLELIDRYSADSLRMTLAVMAAQGRDIKLAPRQVEGYRNFGTKLWNASRFCQMNGCVLPAGFDPAAVNQIVNRWIVGEVARVAAETARGIMAYRFNDAAGGLYRFVWGVFCDWYLEFIKPILNGDGPAAGETRATAAWTLDQILLLLHPFMPFITEELNEHFRFVGDRPLITAKWPVLEGLDTPEARAEMDWVVRLIVDIRAVLGSGRRARDLGTIGAARGLHPSPRAVGGRLADGRDAQRRSAVDGGGGDLRLALGRYHRCSGRAGAAEKGGRQDRKGNCRHRRASLQPRLPREGRPGSGRGREGKADRTGRATGSPSGCGGAVGRNVMCECPESQNFRTRHAACRPNDFIGLAGWPALRFRSPTLVEA